MARLLVIIPLLIIIGIRFYPWYAKRRWYAMRRAARPGAAAAATRPAPAAFGLPADSEHHAVGLAERRDPGDRRGDGGHAGG
ncbi:hypothetical protein AB0K43_17920 [Kitasatospora sp. NPDC049258]|uniref:hypothetical protein n=1 Tax=Kitasatospora sp. NPDC049258 TaxID=3155394 RepID=UPI0034478BAD